MTSWIKQGNPNQRKRIYKYDGGDKGGEISTVPILKSMYYKCFVPYLFSYENARRLTNIIREFSIMNLSKVKKIINVYQPYYKNNIPASGLGDFIRGSIFLYQYCKIANIQFEMNYNNHMMNAILDNEHTVIKEYYLKNIVHCDVLNYYPNKYIKDVEVYADVITNINKYLAACMIDEDGTLYACIKPYPIFNISDDDKLFIKNNLKYNKILEKELETIKKKYNLISKKYSIIHIRSGDKYLIKNNTDSYELIEKFTRIIQEYLKKSQHEAIILLGDCKNILSSIVKNVQSLISFENNISHMGEGVESSIETIKNNMIEFYIMSESLSIFTISTYQHGSGFSKWCAEIYNIPYTDVYITM